MPQIDGRAKYLQTVERLKRKQDPRKKSIDEMNLDELLQMEERYLAWYPTHPDHPEREVKKHIYEHYIKPRIELLRDQSELKNGIETYLFGETPATSQLPLNIEGEQLVQHTDNQ